jgi:hypothetical protein
LAAFFRPSHGPAVPINNGKAATMFARALIRKGKTTKESDANAAFFLGSSKRIET